jgi:hypothetical protein
MRVWSFGTPTLGVCTDPACSQFFRRAHIAPFYLILVAFITHQVYCLGLWYAGPHPASFDLIPLYSLVWTLSESVATLRLPHLNCDIQTFYLIGSSLKNVR